MKFRYHRGGFAESMATQVEIEPTIEALRKVLTDNFAALVQDDSVVLDPPVVKPYSDNLDERNGWKQTNIVLLAGTPIGFTDEIPS
jgi:hypothetical protein